MNHKSCWCACPQSTYMLQLLNCHIFQYSFKMRFGSGYQIYRSRVQLIRDCRFSNRRKPFKQSYKITYKMCCLLLLMLLLLLSTKSKLAYRISRQQKPQPQATCRQCDYGHLFFMCGSKDGKYYNGVRLKRCDFLIYGFCLFVCL